MSLALDRPATGPVFAVVFRLATFELGVVVWQAETFMVAHAKMRIGTRRG
jgi:hypothetical protein